MPPDPGACLAAGFPPCPPRSSVMPPPPSASPKLHDLSPAPYGKGMASPGHDPLRLQRPAGGAFVGQEAPRPVGVHPGSPQQPQVSPQLSSSCSPGHQPALCANSPSSPLLPGAQEPTCLQPRSPARPPGMGHLQHQLPKVPEKASAATRPLPLPEVREDSNHSLAPTPVSVKREPQDLDQLYLDDGKCPRPGGRAGWRRAERAEEGCAAPPPSAPRSGQGPAQVARLCSVAVATTTSRRHGPRPWRARAGGPSRTQRCLAALSGEAPDAGRAPQGPWRA